MKLALGEEWALGGPIGGGGFGTVYEAESAAGVRAAVKLVPKAPGTEREMLFTNLDGIRHVVPVIDSGEYDDNWVLVMPRAEKSLRDHLNQAGPLPLSEAVAILTDVAQTLDDLKGRDIVHRDLKPENILLLNGHWCLADFGLARYAQAATAKQTFKGWGTFAYMAPELWNNQRASSASDIYALGVLAHELLEGATPFTGPSETDIADQHRHSSPPQLTTAPPLLAMLITECLYKAPQARPATGNVLARLQTIPGANLTGGLAALSKANEAVVVRRAEDDRRASQHASEAERRQALFESAKVSFGFISDTILAAIRSAAPSVDVRPGSLGGWTVRLDNAQLTLPSPSEVPPEIWRSDQTPAPFDVIASAIIKLQIPANPYGYQGRSHSLWYADAQTEGDYRWFETAFMNTPFRPVAHSTEPFALAPQQEARTAISTTVGVYQVAWPFMPLALGELDEFIERWATLLAQGASGQLGRPSQMPERAPKGSWRV
ncbi:serine/threonine protein kinase [Streptomyces sp. NBC_00047]|uniref:serine/threonine-protein kinase n=1 Tax=Streptomyces sp. NBC_00047 TaxID=2975627 RepID=UPI0022544A9C|nr:serine/threonine-protein kinase [Streptomyces sp. NBC_00047]MCX5613531.1 serine/threonine protein kinase [Streptomyces sp. NBC_00047]